MSHSADTVPGALNVEAAVFVPSRPPLAAALHLKYEILTPEGETLTISLPKSAKVVDAKVKLQTLRGFSRFGQHLFLADSRAVDSDLPLSGEAELERAIAGLERKLFLILHNGLAGIIATTLREVIFQLPKISDDSPRYTDLKMIESIGSVQTRRRTGAFGAVACAKDQRDGRTVAIKKLSQVFEDAMDAKALVRNTQILRHLKHDNIISLLDLFLPPKYNHQSQRSFSDVYVVTEYMQSDLHRIIHSKQPLSNDHIQYFMYQLLSGIAYFHAADIAHLNLTPSKVLVNANCDLKITGFYSPPVLLGAEPPDDDVST